MNVLVTTFWHQIIKYHLHVLHVHIMTNIIAYLPHIWIIVLIDCDAG